MIGRLDLSPSELDAADLAPGLISVPDILRLIAEVRRRRAEDDGLADAVAVAASLAGVKVGDCCFAALEQMLGEVNRLRLELQAVGRAA